MRKKREAYERKLGLRPTYAYKGPRYTVRVSSRREPPQQYVVWDAKLRETVGDTFGSQALAEKRAEELN